METEGWKLTDLETGFIIHKFSTLDKYTLIIINDFEADEMEGIEEDYIIWV